MRLIAERNSEDLSRELLGSKDKIQTLQNQLDTLHAEHRALQVVICIIIMIVIRNNRLHMQDEYGSGKFEEMEKKHNELRHENERMKHTMARFEEHEAQLQKRIDEKMHENTQLSSMLDQVCVDVVKRFLANQFLFIQDKRGFRSTSSEDKGAMRNYAKIDARTDC